MAALLTEYQSWKGMGSMPAMELMQTMRPPPAARMCGSTALTLLSMPKRFSSSWAWASALLVSSAAPDMPKPALHTSMSMRPARAHDLVDGGLDGGFVGDVGGYVFKALGGLVVAGEFKDTAAGARERERSAAPYAAASAGYYSDLHVRFLLCVL